MAKVLCFSVILCCLIFLSCEQDIPSEEIDPNPIDEIIGMYDCQVYLWTPFISDPPQIKDEVVEIQKDQNGIDYDFFVDGYWEASLLFDRVYDNVLYLKIYEMPLVHSGNILADMRGNWCDLTDHPESDATFQINKNKKIQVSYIWDNWRDVSTQEYIDGYAVWYYEGYRR